MVRLVVLYLSLYFIRRNGNSGQRKTTWRGSQAYAAGITRVKSKASRVSELGCKLASCYSASATDSYRSAGTT